MPPRRRPRKRKEGSSSASTVPSIPQKNAGSPSTSTHSRLPSKSTVSTASSSGGGGSPSTATDSVAGGYVLIHKSFWNNMCSNLACSSCGKKRVEVNAEKLSGLASKLIMHCTGCGVVLSQVTSSPNEEENNTDPASEELDFEVNRRFVKFFFKENKTYNDVVMFSKTLGIPCITKTMFEKYRDELLAEEEGN